MTEQNKKQLDQKMLKAFHQYGIPPEVIQTLMDDYAIDKFSIMMVAKFLYGAAIAPTGASLNYPGNIRYGETPKHDPDLEGIPDEEGVPLSGDEFGRTSRYRAKQSPTHIELPRQSEIDDQWSDVGGHTPGDPEIEKEKEKAFLDRAKNKSVSDFYKNLQNKKKKRVSEAIDWESDEVRPPRVKVPAKKLPSDWDQVFPYMSKKSKKRSPEEREYIGSKILDMLNNNTALYHKPDTNRYRDMGYRFDVGVADIVRNIGKFPKKYRNAESVKDFVTTYVRLHRQQRAKEILDAEQDNKNYEIVFTTKDGAYYLLDKHKSTCDEEAFLLSHCGMGGNSSILSLRRRRDRMPVITFAVRYGPNGSLHGSTATQILGINNSENSKYIPQILEVLEHFDMKTETPNANWVVQTGDERSAGASETWIKRKLEKYGITFDMHGQPQKRMYFVNLEEYPEDWDDLTEEQQRFLATSVTPSKFAKEYYLPYKISESYIDNINQLFKKLFDQYVESDVPPAVETQILDNSTNSNFMHSTKLRTQLELPYGFDERKTGATKNILSIYDVYMKALKILTRNRPK